MTLFDIHTHPCDTGIDSNKLTSSIVNTSPPDFEDTLNIYPGCLFSCGIHPWYFDDYKYQLEKLYEIALHHKVIAIGEAGIDKTRGVPIDKQIKIFKKHIDISEGVNKPIIIHAVKAWDEIYHLRKQRTLSQAWIIHGFRGNRQVAEQLLDVGFMFSLGIQFNEEAINNIPLNHLFCETDDKNIHVKDVYEKVAYARSISIDELAQQIKKNVEKVFPSLITNHI